MSWRLGPGWGSQGGTHWPARPAPQYQGEAASALASGALRNRQASVLVSAALDRMTEPRFDGFEIGIETGGDAAGVGERVGGQP